MRLKFTARCSKPGGAEFEVTEQDVPEVPVPKDRTLQGIQLAIAGLIVSAIDPAITAIDLIVHSTDHC